jgi:hypothetical protein
VRLLERNADPVFFAPYNPTIPDHLIGLDDQLEFVGNAERSWNVQGGAEVGHVSDSATEGTVVEFDRPALKHSTSNSFTIFIHARFSSMRDALFLGTGMNGIP